MLPRALTVAALAFLAVRAQEPTFRVTVSLVQVDAVVTDSKGNQIRDLEASDFQVFEDGKLQKVTSFSRIDGSRSPAVGQPGVKPRIPTKEEISRSIVLMFDDSAPHAEEELTPLLPSVRKLVADQIGPRDLTAVTASRGGMEFYQQFTNDKQQIYAALDRLVHRRGFGMWTQNIPMALNPDTGKLEAAFQLKQGEPGLGYRDPKHPPNPIGHLMRAIQGLQNIPGRKALVLFTHSFPAPRSLIDLANRAGVVIYVVDTHDRLDGVIPSNAPYRLLAKETGGLYLRSAPGAALDRDLGRVLDDVNGYYLLGYRPERTESELQQGRLAHHEIRVQVSRAGLEVRSRNGYLGVPDTGSTPALRTSAEYLLDALSSPFRVGKIHMEVETRYRASSPDPKTKQRGVLLEVTMPVEGRDLRVADREDGNKTLTYSALVTVERQDGTPAVKDGKTFSFQLTPEQAAQLAGNGVRPSLDILLPGPGAYQVRAAVRDETSGEVGSAYTFVEAPDFNQQKIALASIEFSPSPEKWHAGQINDFAPGSPVYFRCGVFGFHSAPTKPSNVEVQVILFREEEPKPYLDTGTAPVPPPSLAEHTIGGRLDTTGLPPGNYALQLVAWDRIARKSAMEWARLKLRN